MTDSYGFLNRCLVGNIQILEFVARDHLEYHVMQGMGTCGIGLCRLILV